MILSALIGLLNPFPSSWAEAFSRLRYDLAILYALVSIIVIVVIVFLINLILAPYRIHKEQQTEIIALRKAVKGLRETIKQLTDKEEEGNMSESEALRYALKRSGLTKKNEIETALRKAALQKKDPITVWIQPIGDSIWMPVPQDIFENHAIELACSDEACGRVYNIHDPEAEPYGISPYFCRHQIERLWKREKSDSQAG